MIVIVILLCILLIKKISIYSKQETDVQKFVYDSGNPGPTIGLIAGVHGNERSGSNMLLHLIKAGKFNSITRGCVKVIPVVNPWGFARNRRESQSGDLNRIYTPSNSTKDSILRFLSDCDIVVDFHEGWSWHRINPSSIGSTVTPSLLEGRPLSSKIVESLNSSPEMVPIIQNDPRKQFDVGADEVVCEIHSTMECYFRKQNRLHILVEIPGQNSSNPTLVRQSNVRTVVSCLLREYRMISHTQAF